ncbi:MAG: pyridoxine 5'-phosphate synthase [Elusimicrobia bacterium]|nr:pyridoxine 5'-phosphate synthase [Elusimicrobiota bacterium]
MKLELGVNIDHIATLRQARGGAGPSPLKAAQACVNLGAEYIVIHLRRDRRHIQENDLRLLTKHLRKHVHLEMAATQEMSDLAVKYKPGSVCIVPEYPGELTTSGGLKMDDKHLPLIQKVVKRLKEEGIKVSLFVDPKANDIRAAKRIGADIVELCTKDYSEAKTEKQRQAILEELSVSSILGRELGLEVHSGHGLDYENVEDVANLSGMQCLNIGFSIMSRAVFVGLPQAVLEMRQKIS